MTFLASAYIDKGAMNIFGVLSSNGSGLRGVFNKSFINLASEGSFARLVLFKQVLEC